MSRFSFNHRGHRGNGANALRSSWLLCALSFLCGLAFATPATSADSYYAARRLVAATQSAYDADAQDYFDRAEALSAGCFDLTGISGTYTESYVKGAINTFVTTCKADGTWSKLTEVYLLVGVQFGAITAKLKYDSVATLTNNGFVSGDYLAAGSGAGLTGDGSSYYATSHNRVDSGSVSLSFYCTSMTGGSQAFVFGGGGGHIGSSTGTYLARKGSGSRDDFNHGTNSALYVSSAGARMIIGSARTYSDLEIYTNGISSGTASASSESSTTEYWLFNDGSYGSTSRSTFIHIGTGLSDTDAANLTTATETLMDAFGCGVIP